MSYAGVALVTGSGKRRVGWYVADALAARGYRLVVHYHLSRADAEATVADFRGRGVEAVALGADLTDETAARLLVEQSVNQFGRLDVLMNCAAIWIRTPLEHLKAADLRRHFETNTLGTFVCSQQAGLAMVKQPEGGCIVTVGDWADARPYADYAAYIVSKAAIPGLTRCLAVELGRRNPKVRVNCILPGPVMLPPDLPGAERAESIAGTLVGHEGRPENVAQAVLAFIDNDFITGACLPVDGGRTIYAAD
jgi:pteridine reductase